MMTSSKPAGNNLIIGVPLAIRRRVTALRPVHLANPMNYPKVRPAPQGASPCEPSRSAHRADDGAFMVPVARDSNILIGTAQIRAVGRTADRMLAMATVVAL
jgi:hypothetical protein